MIISVSREYRVRTERVDDISWILIMTSRISINLIKINITWILSDKQNWNYAATKVSKVTYQSLSTKTCFVSSFFEQNSNIFSVYVVWFLIDAVHVNTETKLDLKKIVQYIYIAHILHPLKCMHHPLVDIAQFRLQLVAITN